MKILFINLILLFGLSLSGCIDKWRANEHALLHNIAKQNCVKIKNSDERQECMKRHNEPYQPHQYNTSVGQ